MKLTVLFFAFSLLAIHSFSQKPYNKNLKVNDGEFIASGILFGGGTISVLIGVLAKTSNVFLQAAVGDNSKNTAGNTYLIAGAASMLVGTLLYFDARDKQKKRFRLSISSIRNPIFDQGKIFSSNIPSLSILLPINR